MVNSVRFPFQAISPDCCSGSNSICLYAYRLHCSSLAESLITSVYFETPEKLKDFLDNKYGFGNYSRNPYRQLDERCLWYFIELGAAFGKTEKGERFETEKFWVGRVRVLRVPYVG